MDKHRAHARKNRQARESMAVVSRDLREKGGWRGSYESVPKTSSDRWPEPGVASHLFPQPPAASLKATGPSCCCTSPATDVLPQDKGVLAPHGRKDFAPPRPHVPLPEAGLKSPFGGLCHCFSRGDR
jgi:hypothetical protein